MCRAIQIMQEGKKKAEAETRQVSAENRQVKAEARLAKAETREVRAEYKAKLKERDRKNKLLIKMLKESGCSEAEIKSYLNNAALANA